MSNCAPISKILFPSQDRGAAELGKETGTFTRAEQMSSELRELEASVSLSGIWAHKFPSKIYHSIKMLTRFPRFMLWACIIIFFWGGREVGEAIVYKALPLRAWQSSCDSVLGDCSALSGIWSVRKMAAERTPPHGDDGRLLGICEDHRRQCRCCSITAQIWNAFSFPFEEV